MAHRTLAPHIARNCRPILGVLRTELAASESLLEIGSGNGQHATTFSKALSGLVWQTSDRRQNHAAIRAWLAEAQAPDVRSPIALDVLEDSSPDGEYDAVFSANTAHIMSLKAVENMFGVAATVLGTGGVFCLYGPFRQNGEFSSTSNANFHDTLQAQDSEMGIRDLEELEEFASTGGLERRGLYAMPANNLLAVWRRD